MSGTSLITPPINTCMLAKTNSIGTMEPLMVPAPTRMSAPQIIPMSRFLIRKMFFNRNGAPPKSKVTEYKMPVMAEIPSTKNTKGLMYQNASGRVTIKNWSTMIRWIGYEKK